LEDVLGHDKGRKSGVLKSEKKGEGKGEKMYQRE